MLLKTFIKDHCDWTRRELGRNISTIFTLEAEKQQRIQGNIILRNNIDLFIIFEWNTELFEIVTTFFGAPENEPYHPLEESEQISHTVTVSESVCNKVYLIFTDEGMSISVQSTEEQFGYNGVIKCKWEDIKSINLDISKITPRSKTLNLNDKISNVEAIILAIQDK